jgi:hypothetical protein
MMQRVYSRGIKDHPEYLTLKNVWETQTLPGISRQLEAYDSFETLLPARVVLMEGVRALECVLLRKDGRFHLVTLMLVESAQGEIRIEDLHFSSSLLTVTSTMRHTMLLLRAPLPGLLESEEIRVANLGKVHGLTASLAIQAFAKGDYEAAFKLWSGLPAELKATRIWRDHRNHLAFQGVTGAMRELTWEARAGAGGPPMVRFSLATANQGETTALEVIEEVLIAHHELPWLRAIKAEMVLKEGRVSEALELARDICALGPYNTLAYSVALRAAATGGREEVAFDVLQGWSKLIPAAEIDRQLDLADTPALAKFRASPRFIAWKNAATPGGLDAAVSARPERR